MYARRFYTGPGDTDRRKFSDPSNLTAPEIRLIEQYRDRVRPCQDIIVHASREYTPNDVPAWTAFFSRSDELWMRVSTGRLTVGEANLYSLSSVAILQQELAATGENREATPERRRQAQETLVLSSHILQSERDAGRPARCDWVGNVLHCPAD